MITRDPPVRLPRRLCGTYILQPAAWT